MKYKIGLIEHSLVVPEDVSAIPLGTILSYTANSLTPPPGFLYAEGQAVSRTMYADYFALVGTLYGEGDGSTTFNLPNMVGKFPEGALSAGSVKSAGLPNIEGHIAAGGFSTSSSSFTSTVANNTPTGAFSPVSYSSALQSVTSVATNVFSADFDASDSNPIYGNSQTVQPPALTVRWIVKVYNASVPSSQIDLSVYASDLASRLQRHQVPAFNQRVKITTSQIWSAPVSGWYKFTIKGAGGGGGLGSRVEGKNWGGAGGGEGGTTFAYEKMLVGETVTIAIGAGGSHSTSTSANGSNGGNSTITVNGNTYTAGGGGGGTSHRQTSPSNSGGSGTIPGASGGSQLFSSDSGYLWCGNGGGAGGATGGSNGAGVSAGTAVLNSGGGGGGGVGTIYGSDGANGHCFIEYFDPTL